MKNRYIPIASTGTSEFGNNVYTLSDLENLKALHERYIFPIGIQHDPRIVPQGRIISAEIRSLEGKEHFLQGEVEWFDVSLEALTDTGEKEIRIRTFAEPTVLYDSHFKDAESQEIIYELSRLLKGRAEEERKSENPFLSVLTIAASYPFGKIFKGFHDSFEKNGFKNFKAILDHLIIRKTKAEERIISFISSMAFGNQIIHAEILLTNPNPKTIDRFFGKDLKRFDPIIQKQFLPGKGIRKMVYSYKDKEFNFLYALRKDGIPLEARKKN